MSSTSIVIKCLSDAHQNGTPHGQITIGTLILQDCMVRCISVHLQHFPEFHSFLVALFAFLLLYQCCMS